jgi:hypothetical protein
VKQLTGISIEATLKSGTSALLTDTFGFFANTCTVSNVKGTTETDVTDEPEPGVKVTTTYTATGTNPIDGPITELSWSSCKEGNPVPHANGSLSVSWIKGTTNGTVKSKNAQVTVPSALGTLTCTTPKEGTDLGTLTGVASSLAHATMDINAVLNCGITAKWTGTYTVTTPTGLGVVE